ncbi:MAG: alkaline phosphatase family protein, partial [Candidatus Hydrothermarchaeales archaeon]
ITGKYAGDCNLPGMRWWEDGTTRSYFTFGRTMNHDLNPKIKLIYEYTTSACIFSPVLKGADYSIPLFGNAVSHIINNWIFFDKLGFHLAKKTLEKKIYQLLILCLYAVDELGHLKGCKSKAALDAYKVTDAKIGELEKTLSKTYEDYQLLIVSDHGLTGTHTHIDLPNVIRSLNFSVRNYPFNFNLKQEIFVGVSGNSMANIYLTNGQKNRGKTLDIISRRLTGLQGIDLVLHQNDGVHVLKDDSEAIIDCKNGKYRYESIKGDPLSLEEYSEEWLSEEKWYDATLNTQYPDSTVQISQIFNSSRVGDLVVTAKNGYDLRTLEFPEHKASHGSLNKEHMLVPVISNKKVVPRRTTDIFNSILDYLNQ